MANDWEKTLPSVQKSLEIELLYHPVIETNPLITEDRKTGASLDLRLQEDSQYLKTRSLTGLPKSSSGAKHSLDSQKQEGLSMETWIIQEFCELGSLQGAIKQHWFHIEALNGRVFPDMVALLNTARNILSGLAYLHGRNIIHGDLKSPNVLMSNATTQADARGYIAKLADFGLARQMQNMQTHIQTLQYGTVSHDAPEKLSGSKLAPAGDIYAFGVMLWEMYTREIPWDGLAPGAIISKSVAGERPTIPADMPRWFARMIQRCWAQDSYQRPTCEELLGEIDQHLPQTMQEDSNSRNEVQVELENILIPLESSSEKNVEVEATVGNVAETPDLGDLKERLAAQNILQNSLKTEQLEQQSFQFRSKENPLLTGKQDFSFSRQSFLLCGAIVTEQNAAHHDMPNASADCQVTEQNGTGCLTGSNFENMEAQMKCLVGVSNPPDVKTPNIEESHFGHTRET